MTQSFILMALGIGIGYSITLWLQRSRGTNVPAIGPITDMQSNCHDTVSGANGQMATVVTSGAIDKLAKKEGAEIVMFVNDKGKLVVVDTETGTPLPEFDDSVHEHHPAEIRLDQAGEPVLYDKGLGEPIVVHEKPYFNHFRIPVSNPKSGRHIAAHVVYFWRYSGSSSCCTWSGGSHVVRRRP